MAEISTAKSAETVGGCGASGVMSGAWLSCAVPVSLLRGAVRAENVGGLRSKRRRALSLGAVSVARGVLPRSAAVGGVCFRSAPVGLRLRRFSSSVARPLRVRVLISSGSLSAGRAKCSRITLVIR